MCANVRKKKKKRREICFVQHQENNNNNKIKRNLFFNTSQIFNGQMVDAHRSQPFLHQITKESLIHRIVM